MNRVDYNDLSELSRQILDIFEDFLTEKRIMIPNEDRDEAIGEGEDPEDVAILYGMDYGKLKDDIEATLINWGFVEEVEA